MGFQGKGGLARGELPFRWLKRDCRSLAAK
jgi:hypothetical protein